MKLSEYIKELQEFLAKNGDLDCWSSEKNRFGYKLITNEFDVIEIKYIDKSESIEGLIDDSIFRLWDVLGIKHDIQDFEKVCVIN